MVRCNLGDTDGVDFLVDLCEKNTYLKAYYVIFVLHLSRQFLGYYSVLQFWLVYQAFSSLIPVPPLCLTVKKLAFVPVTKAKSH